MPRPSKIETSENFNEIIDLLLAGYSGRYISDYLKEEYNENISNVALTQYRKNKLNVKAAVKHKVLEKEKEKKRDKSVEKTVEKEAEKKFQAKESFEAAVDIKLNDISKLDKLIQDASDIEVEMDLLNTAEKPDPCKIVDLQIKYKKLGLNAIKIKQDILDDKSVDVTMNTMPTLRDLFSDELVESVLDDIEESHPGESETP